MNFSKHCDLCENEITYLEKGLTCKLTNKKPEFKNTCPEIKLDNKFVKKLEIANLELETIKKKKNTILFSFFFLIIVGFLLIYKSSAFAKMMLSPIYFWYYKVGLISVGVSNIIVACFKLRAFKGEFGTARHKKNNIEEVLEKYGICYELKLDFKEKIHGIQEVIVKMNFKNWKKKQTETTYKIS